MDSVYKKIRIVGSSTHSWEDAARSALETVGHSIRDIRVVEVESFDIKVEGSKPVAFRTELSVAFKYHQD